MTPDERLSFARVALARGQWAAARVAFEDVLDDSESAHACFGSATASWWLGENKRAVDRCGRAYTLFRRSGDDASAAQCAVWLAITYKANFANAAAANGWLGRAERLLEPIEPGPLHGWLWVARAYRNDNLDDAAGLTQRAVTVARNAGDIDLELVALAQLGLIRVGRGETADGFALLDEAAVAALAGERSTLDTVVYVCCDMLNACELVSDLERAVQWCAVADDFVETYGCPFLYAECRIYYGSVLMAKGRWDEAERQWRTGLRITENTCPGLYGRALNRLAGLRIRQGRFSEAERLLDRVAGSIQAHAEQSITVAALQLARGDASGAVRRLEQRMDRLVEQHTATAAALNVLIDSYLATGDCDKARTAAQRLSLLADAAPGGTAAAIAAAAAGRVALACGDTESAAVHLESALAAWTRLDIPFEIARARLDLSRSHAAGKPDLAIEQARMAFTGFEALGATVYADRAAAFLRSMGVSARPGIRGLGLLTAREREVLQLLGAGLSNPEIGERLYLSRKTVSHHVSSILAKLGVRNRAAAAAYAALADRDTE